MASDNEVIFEPKGEKNVSGSFALPGGKTFDIGKRLQSQTGGKGRIATSDPTEIENLDRIEALKRRKATRRSSKKTAAAKAAPAAAPASGTSDDGGNA